MNNLADIKTDNETYFFNIHIALNHGLLIQRCLKIIEY
jgi:hypothetical protein